MSLFIDHSVALTATRQVTADLTTLAAVRDAYNAIAAQIAASGRTPVLLEVTVRVAPQEP